MTKSMSTNPLMVACVLALAAMASAAPMQSYAEPQGFVTSTGGSVVMSGSGLCVHAESGRTYLTDIPCSPNPVAPPVSQIVQPDTAPVAEAPPAPAAPPVLARVTFDADALFDFDKAALRPAGQLALDKFADDVKGMNAGVVTAFGYTDRIGTDAYNQNLSNERAQTVRAYLQDKGIDRSNMRAEGRGNTQPVTKPGECEGQRSLKVIECLQPNRRVEVEVTGTSFPLLTAQ